MSTPLQVAVDIARTISDLAHNAAALNVEAQASELAGRHAGYSEQAIAETLKEEGAAAGLSLIQVEPSA